MVLRQVERNNLYLVIGVAHCRRFLVCFMAASFLAKSPPAPLPINALTIVDRELQDLSARSAVQATSEAGLRPASRNRNCAGGRYGNRVGENTEISRKPCPRLCVGETYLNRWATPNAAPGGCNWDQLAVPRLASNAVVCFDVLGIQAGQRLRCTGNASILKLFGKRMQRSRVLYF
jgi:hypothetical protein